ncbi:23975_t:CDS:2, partial [Racocetra persica]
SLVFFEDEDCEDFDFYYKDNVWEDEDLKEYDILYESEDWEDCNKDCDKDHEGKDDI